MRLGIMQPYFFPYLGHFSLIAAVDKWIVFDITQYTPRSWMNRNRIIAPTGGCKWLTIPLANASIHKKTQEISILNTDTILKSVFGHLSHYRRAPYYSAVMQLLDEVFVGDPSLVRVNVRGLSAVCRYLNIPFRYQICSELSLDLPSALGPGDWAREICTALGATTYINPIGGRALFDPSSFHRQGIDLQFLQAEPFVYPTRQLAFEPNLSILDVLMWNSPEIVRKAVNAYALSTGTDQIGIVQPAQNTACSPRSALTSPATSRS